MTPAARTLYRLIHRHHFVPPEHEPYEHGEPLFRSDDEEDFKELGLYTTREAAERRIVLARAEPGFRDSPDGFEVHPCTVDEPRWTRGF
ncbi:hypothetical protein ACIRBX_16240 [Kitasatospora sp. NPDC096147]|uniref:hypothetical protein n=1 Tax=Kitasatospora sp. NPDC096147 TaxID=3364093 RepID=UPI003818FDB8